MKKFNKIAAAITGACLIGGAASAGIVWELTSPEGIFISGQNTGLPGNSLPDNAVWQLWISDDATTILDGPGVALASAQSSVVGFRDVGANDVLVARGVTSPGNISGFLLGSVSGSTLDALAPDADVNNGGAVYGIIYFDQDSSGGVNEGDWAGATAELNLSTFTVWGEAPPQPPPAANDEVRFGTSPLTIDNSMQVLPEPSTYALFALGLATIAWRRRKSSK